MIDNVIVGNNLAGILVAQDLERVSHSWSGLERQDQGGHSSVPVYRVRLESSLTCLQSRIADSAWKRIDGKLLQPHKGEWVDWTSESELFLNWLNEPHFRSEPLQESLASLEAKMHPQFRFRQEVRSVNTTDKTLELDTGEVIAFSRLFWTDSLTELLKVTEGSPASKLTLFKNVPHHSGVAVEFKLSTPMAPEDSELVVPFRSKDDRISAIGSAHVHVKQQELRWILPLESELAAQHQEVARIVTAFKRDLFRQMPDVKTQILGERIVFIEKLSSAPEARAESAELWPDIFYVGEQLELDGVESSPLDRMCATLLSTSPSRPHASTGEETPHLITPEEDTLRDDATPLVAESH